MALDQLNDWIYFDRNQGECAECDDDKRKRRVASKQSRDRKKGGDGKGGGKGGGADHSETGGTIFDAVHDATKA